VTAKESENPRAFVPVVTWTLIGLNLILFLWDRRWNPFGSNLLFADLMMRPADVVSAMKGGEKFPFTTLLTSMFMHGSLGHIFGNLLFLWVFGPLVEQVMGGWRFTLYYLAWGVMAALAHIYVDPFSTVPTLGASGAIGGVLGSYLLLFPTQKIEIVIPILAFAEFELSAWILLGAWFLWQVFVPQAGVANWAHVGGFLAGMVTVLVMGGARRILARLPEGELDEL